MSKTSKAQISPESSPNALEIDGKRILVYDQYNYWWRANLELVEAINKIDIELDNWILEFNH